jgi:hypothetical protein
VLGFASWWRLERRGRGDGDPIAASDPVIETVG